MSNQVDPLEPSFSDQLRAACLPIPDAKGWVMGSGFLLSPTLVVTAAHVISMFEKDADIVLEHQGLRASARIESLNHAADTAVLRLSMPIEGVQPLPFS